METPTLPKNIVTQVAKLTAKPWTTLAQADAAADFVRELRDDAHRLGALTEQELGWKAQIDRRLAEEANAMTNVATVEAELKANFVAFTEAETKRINATLPTSKHRKSLEGKGWKVQLKNKPAFATVLDEDTAVTWLEVNEPTAVKVVKKVIMGQLTQNPTVFARLKAMSQKALEKIGLGFVDVVQNGSSTVTVTDSDAR